MKNKLFVGLITFFVSITICIGILNFTNSNSKKKYFFDRKYDGKNILEFEKTADKMNYESEYLMCVPSDSLIVEKKMIKNEKNKVTYKLYFSDLNFKKLDFKTAIIPKIADLRLCNKGNLFFVANFKLFNHDFICNRTNEIKLNNFKVVSIKSLGNSKSNFLCFGELFDGSSYKTGFYIINITTSKVKLLKVLSSSDKSNIISTSLQYSGNFSVNTDNGMSTYCCNKYSKIYFFDNDGALINEITTNDNVPLPKILTNKNGDSFYARGTTRNTNMGMFVKKNKVYVFSSRADLEFSILIDEYFYKSGKYIKSYKLNYKNFNSKNIDMVFLNDDKLVLGFNTNYAFFKLSI